MYFVKLGNCARDERYRCRSYGIILLVYPISDEIDNFPINRELSLLKVEIKIQLKELGIFQAHKQLELPRRFSINILRKHIVGKLVTNRIGLIYLVCLATIELTMMIVHTHFTSAGRLNSRYFVFSDYSSPRFELAT